jgi:hypothetical protein
MKKKQATALKHSQIPVAIENHIWHFDLQLLTGGGADT